MARQVALTPEQIQAVNAARRVLNDLIPDIDAAEKCGVNCQALRQKKQEINDGLDNIVKYFGSGMAS